MKMLKADMSLQLAHIIQEQKHGGKNVLEGNCMVFQYI